MATYSVHFFCNECGQVHPLGIPIALNDGPVDKASIGDTYAGGDLPPEIAILKDNITICSKTGILTSQEDNDQVFLVPVDKVNLQVEGY